jgi:hypothetical protein
MNQKVDVPVSVISFYNTSNSTVKPVKVYWNGREYLINQIGLHHTFREGRTLYHIFSVVGEGTFFRLKLNTDNLFWRLEEVSDGLPG